MNYSDLAFLADVLVKRCREVQLVQLRRNSFYLRNKLDLEGLEEAIRVCV